MRISRPMPVVSMVSNGEMAKMPSCRYRGEERGLDIVAGEAPAHLGQVVGAEGEEVRHGGDLAGGHRCPGYLDHGTDRDPGCAVDAVADPLGLRAYHLKLLDRADQR